MAVCPERARASERHPADGAQMILKLAGDAALDGPVPGVMDARRHLIGDQAPADHEELDGQHPDVIEGAHDPLRVEPAARSKPRIRKRRDAVCSECRRRACSRTADRTRSDRRLSARSTQRDLPGKILEFLVDQSAPPIAAQAASISAIARNTNCPLPSYPRRRVFSTPGKSELCAAAPSRSRLSTGACAATGIFRRANSAFSASRSCETSSAARGGRTWRHFLQRLQRASRRCFPNRTSHVAAASQFGQLRRILESLRSDWARLAHRARRRCDPGIDSARPGDIRRAPASAPAARSDDADVHQFQGLRGSGLASTAAVCAARNASNAARTPVILVGQHRSCEQGRIGRTGGSDRKGRDRHAARHLRNRQQRVDAAQCLGLDGNSKHGNRGLRSGHSRQVRRAAGAGDDGFEAALRARKPRIRTADRACDAPRSPGPRVRHPTESRCRPRPASSPSRKTIP